MEFLHPAVWHDHDIDFARWLHHAMWHVALDTVNSPSGSTLQCVRRLWGDMHWISPNVRHIGILHLVSISTTSPQATCHSAPVSEILSKSDHSRQKMTSCRFSRWRISAILDFRGPIMGSLKSPCTTSYRSSIENIAVNCCFWENRVVCILATDIQTDRRTDGQHRCTKPLSLSRAGLNNSFIAS